MFNISNTNSSMTLYNDNLTVLLFVKAAQSLLESAILDEEEHVRYEASLLYQSHPKASNLTQIIQDLESG